MAPLLKVIKTICSRLNEGISGNYGYIAPVSSILFSTQFCFVSDMSHAWDRLLKAVLPTLGNLQGRLINKL